MVLKPSKFTLMKFKIYKAPWKVTFQKKRIVFEAFFSRGYVEFGETKRGFLGEKRMDRSWWDWSFLWRILQRFCEAFEVIIRWWVFVCHHLYIIFAYFFKEMKPRSNLVKYPIIYKVLYISFGAGSIKDLPSFGFSSLIIAIVSWLGYRAIWSCYSSDSRAGEDPTRYAGEGASNFGKWFPVPNSMAKTHSELIMTWT